jgi:hypothetical protein
MGQITKGINSITDLAGVRLFKGGTLSDQGARGAREDQERAIAEQEASLNDLAALARMTLGGDNPWANVLNQRLGAYGGYSDASRQGQYDLDPVQQGLWNTQAGTIAAQQRQALNEARIALAKRGITGGPMYEATMRKLTTDFNRMVQQGSLEARHNARQQRMADELQYLSLLGDQVNRGSGLLSTVYGGRQNLIDAYGQRAAEAQARADAGAQRFASALGMLGSGGFSASGTPWSVGGKWTAPMAGADVASAKAKLRTPLKYQQIKVDPIRLGR